MRVLILGHNGMLASMMYDYFKYKGINVYHTQRHDQGKPLFLNIKEQYNNIKYFDSISSSFDYIINCIGITRVDKNAIEDLRLLFYVNAIFPAVLQEYFDNKYTKIIHISTDGVFAGDNGPYVEDHPCDGSDFYSLSKIFGEINAKNILNIRCSMIGIEKISNQHLLSWLLSKKDGEIVPGYTNHIWNGVTTLQLSNFIYEIIINDLFNTITCSTRVLHFSPNKPLSKYELLNLINKIYERKIIIIPSESKTDIKRILKSNYYHLYMKDHENKSTIEEEIVKMKDYFIENVKWATILGEET